MCQTEKKGNGTVDKLLGHARVPAKAESVSHNLINWVIPGVAEFKLQVILYTAWTPVIDTRISVEALSRRGIVRQNVPKVSV